MLLLLHRIFPDGPVLVLSYLIVDPSYGCFPCFIGLFQQNQNSAYNVTFQLSIIVVFFQMIHNEKRFRRPNVKYRTFSEVPTWSNLFPICSYKRQKAAIICTKTVVYTVKIVKYPHSLEPKLWNLLGAEIEVTAWGHDPSGPPMGTPMTYCIFMCCTKWVFI